MTDYKIYSGYILKGEIGWAAKIFVANIKKAFYRKE